MQQEQAYRSASFFEVPRPQQKDPMSACDICYFSEAEGAY